MSSLRDYSPEHIDPVRVSTIKHAPKERKRKSAVKVKSTITRNGTHMAKRLADASKAKPAGMQMRHEVDPVTDIVSRIGDISDVRVLDSYVLYAIYKRPNVTKGGIHLTDNTKAEDDYQGKAGLILKVGPLANLDAKERGIEFKPGMWVAARPSDGWAMELNGVKCRLINEKAITMVLPRPDSIW